MSRGEHWVQMQECREVIAHKNEMHQLGLFRCIAGKQLRSAVLRDIQLRRAVRARRHQARLYSRTAAAQGKDAGCFVSVACRE